MTDKTKTIILILAVILIVAIFSKIWEYGFAAIFNLFSKLF
jgi:hypothetical protein